MSLQLTRLVLATSVLVAATIAYGQTVAEQTLAHVANLRAVRPSNDAKALDEANKRMDNAWAYFVANKREALPVLRDQLTMEIGRHPPNSLVLLDVGYFVFLQDDQDKALAISALYALDPTAAVVRQNAKELFEFAHGVAARRDPKVLSLIDKAFLRQDLDVFIPQHALRLDSTLLCVFLYGVYGEGVEEHLQPALKDPLATRRALEILGWLGSPASVTAAQKAYSVRPDYETFARMTAYMMKAAGPSGRAAMLEVQSDKLDPRSRAYYEKIRPAIVATNFEAQSKQFGPATAPRLSDGEVKSRLNAMNVNEGRDETTQPLSILNSTLPADYLIDALVRIRARAFNRLSDEALSDVEMTNALVNALRYRGR